MKMDFGGPGSMDEGRNGLVSLIGLSKSGFFRWVLEHLSVGLWRSLEYSGCERVRLKDGQSKQYFLD